MSFNEAPDNPQPQSGSDWSLGCSGIVFGGIINLVILLVALMLLGFLSGLSRFVKVNSGFEILAPLLLADALLISWGFEKKATSFAVGLIIAACLTLLLYSKCGFT
jgi:hypothetical protein